MRRVLVLAALVGACSGGGGATGEQSAEAAGGTTGGGGAKPMTGVAGMGAAGSHVGGGGTGTAASAGSAGVAQGGAASGQTVGSGGNPNCEIKENDGGLTTCSELFRGHAACQDSVCVGCSDGSLDCNGIGADGCETPASDANCGDCSAPCSAATHCVVSGQSALCQ